MSDFKDAVGRAIAALRDPASKARDTEGPRLRLNLLPTERHWRRWDSRLPYPKTRTCAHCEHLVFGCGCDDWDLAHGESLLDGLEDAPPLVWADGQVFCWEGCRLAYLGDAEAQSRVYFIQHGMDGAIKIGRARNPAGRRADLQTGTPERLVVLGSFTGGEFVEAQLHAEFAEDRISGEWFRPTDRLVSLILTMTDGEGFDEGEDEAA